MQITRPTAVSFTTSTFQPATLNRQTPVPLQVKPTAAKSAPPPKVADARRAPAAQAKATAGKSGPPTKADWWSSLPGLIRKNPVLRVMHWIDVRLFGR